jgi:hypothetical protein
MNVHNIRLYLKENAGMACTPSGLEYEQVEGFCEHGN